MLGRTCQLIARFQISRTAQHDEMKTPQPKPKQNPPPPIESDEDILVFVVHGMGQRRHKFFENLGYIGRSTDELAQLFFAPPNAPSSPNASSPKENADGKSAVPRLHYVPIEWHMALHQYARVLLRS